MLEKFNNTSVSGKALKAGRNPCYKCDDRTAECHATCVKYLDWSDAVRKQNKVKQENKQANIISYERDKDYRLFRK